jgi:RNA polymerase sigma factor (sigma-70 family)
MTEDVELLSRYATEHSEAAFAELTQRHVDLVYSAALRLVNGDVHSAQDVTQQVFTEVARQAKALARHPALVGWLYTTARQMALRANRTEQRRKAREQAARALAASSACRRPLVQPNGCLLEEPVVEHTQLSLAGTVPSCRGPRNRAGSHALG